jgi:C-terminal processing protease CtpA/Prc
MRTLCLVVTFSALAGPAFAQATRVVVPLPRGQDTSVRLVRVPPTPAQARLLKQRMDEMVAVSKKREEQLVKDWRDTSVSRDRVSMQTEELARGTWDVLKTQGQLAAMCAELRRVDAEATPGTIGLHIDKAARFFFEQGPQGSSFSMEFDGTPRIQSVDAGSPGEKAGVRAGDLWTAINGRRLIGEVRFDELLTPGVTVTVRVNRNGRDVDLPPVPVAKRKSEYPEDACKGALDDTFSIPMFDVRKKIEASMRPSPARPGQADGGFIQMFITKPIASVQYGGAVLQALDDDWRENLGVQGDGVGVIEIRPGTSAESAGLHKFDVIRAVNGETVTSPVVFLRLVSDQRAVVLTVVSKGGAPRTIRLTR